MINLNNDRPYNQQELKNDFILLKIRKLNPEYDKVRHPLIERIVFTFHIEGILNITLIYE